MWRAPRPHRPAGRFRRSTAGRGHALEAGFAYEVADALAGDDQFATLAIDMAEHGFGGGNAVQPDRALGKLQVHGRSPLRPQRSVISTD
jgi:hypothetical protein